VRTIFVQEVNGATALSHLTTIPVYPERVSKPLLLPEQIDKPPDTVPPTLAGLTVNDCNDDTGLPQPELTV
jgi:hypothetical protein